MSKPEGASRVYRFVDAGEPDAFAAAAARLSDRGWDVIESDYELRPAGAFIEVRLWAVPPSTKEEE